MKKIIFMSISMLVLVKITNAQVGIGNATPNANSILDLTNSTNGKALILPKPIAPINLVGNFDTEAMMFYYQDKIYVRTSTGLNVLSPWIYSGVPANGIYSEVGLPIGIGIAPLLNSSAILTIADATSEVTVTTSTASVVIGDNDFNATHMLIDKDELLVKTDANTAGTLKLQEGGGTVQVGQSTTVQSNLNVYGNIKQNDFDLLPLGTIIMWGGTLSGVNPLISGVANTNWALCNGAALPAATVTALNGLTNLPDLRDRFVVGAGLSYTYGITGGAASVAHTHDVNPASFDTPAGQGTHAHSGTTGSSGSNIEKTNTCCDLDWVARDNHTHTFSTDATQGGHLHSIDVPNTPSGAASNTENRPPYIGIFYLMKIR